MEGAEWSGRGHGKLINHSCVLIDFLLKTVSQMLNYVLLFVGLFGT